MIWTTKHLYTNTENNMTSKKLPEGVEVKILLSKSEKYVTLKGERGIITHTHYYRIVRQLKMQYDTK